MYLFELEKYLDDACWQNDQKGEAQIFLNKDSERSIIVKVYKSAGEIRLETAEKDSQGGIIFYD